jgi:hypothetical protein
MRDDVFAVQDDGLPNGSTKGHVQDGPFLRDIDFLPPEHGIDSRSQAGLLRQLNQEREGLVGDAVLRIIKADTNVINRHAFPTLGIICEELAKM